MEKQGYKTTTQYFKNAGTIWFFIGIIIGIVGNFQLTQFLFKDSDVFWYGKLQPVFINIIVFGSIYSYFLAVVFYVLDQLKIEQLKPTLIGNIVFGIYQFSLIFGILTIMLGYNQGRTYGEMNFISDNFMMLVFTIVIVLTLVHTRKLGKLPGSLQFIIIILAGNITTYFLGNFGFPDSYITTVPPTSGFQDAMVQEFYRTAVYVYFITLPLLFLLYIAMRETYQFNDEEQNFIVPLLLLSLLVSFSSGANLDSSAFKNFWTVVGSYIVASIHFLLLGISYILHQIYIQNKKENSNFMLSVAGILLNTWFLIQFVFQLPIIHNYFRYTIIDPSHLIVKLIYISLPVFLVWNQSLVKKEEKISSLVSMSILSIGLFAFVLMIMESIMMSNAIHTWQNGKFAIPEWADIVSKGTIFIWIRTVLEIFILIFSFRIIPLLIEEKGL